MKTYKTSGAGGATPALANNGTNDGHSIGAVENEQAKPFPLHCLPTAFEPMARAICESQGVPEALAGCCVLAALSCSIGAGLQINSGPNQVTRGNLYIMPSGESGSGKSAAFNHALKPFLDYHNETKERWKNEVLPGLETDKEEIEDDIKELRDKRRKSEDAGERGSLRDRIERKRQELKKIEDRLHGPKLFTQDVTSQTLGPLLMRQPGNVLPAFRRTPASLWTFGSANTLRAARMRIFTCKPGRAILTNRTARAGPRVA